MQEWNKPLAEAGYRLTASRKAIIEVLYRSSFPLSPQEILERAQEDHPSLGLVTVYRTLHILLQLSMVRRVHGTNGCHGYLWASSGHSHAIVCARCGRCVEFRPQEGLTELLRQVEEATGYDVQGHLLQLIGLCPACQRSDKDIE